MPSRPAPSTSPGWPTTPSRRAVSQRGSPRHADPGTGFVDAPAAPDQDGTDRVAVFGGGAEALALLRLASVRSDDLLLVAEMMDPATRRFADTFAVELRIATPVESDLAGASAAVVALGDVHGENALVRAARRHGIPIHVAGRPLVSDFSMMQLVERDPSSFPRTRRTTSGPRGTP